MNRRMRILLALVLLSPLAAAAEREFESYDQDRKQVVREYALKYLNADEMLQSVHRDDANALGFADNKDNTLVLKGTRAQLDQLSRIFKSFDFRDYEHSKLLMYVFTLKVVDFDTAKGKIAASALERLSIFDRYLWNDGKLSKVVLVGERSRVEEVVKVLRAIDKK